jgi:hypothetical protein
MAPIAEFDPRNLAEAGWGIIFPQDADRGVREALQPLMEHRRAQSAQKEGYFKEYAYRPGESARDFLSRHGAALGQRADPEKVPYYLLLVGDPESIPYQFQRRLDLQYAVGRLHFDSLEEYANYARGVVKAETGLRSLPRRAAFFGVRNPDDPHTKLTADHLVQPLVQKLATLVPDWAVESALAETATKGRLGLLLGGEQAPALLFAAGHGMGFPAGDPRQLPHQGALLCQEWPGPREWGRKPIPPEFYFSADDVWGDASPGGQIVFLFASYSAGIPSSDDLFQLGVHRSAAIAPRAFVARLPQRLLGYPGGGALAVVGYAGQLWGTWLSAPQVETQVVAVEQSLRYLLGGYPVGYAVERLAYRYAELAATLAGELEDMRFGKAWDDAGLAALWAGQKDFGSFVLLGDPAVMLAVQTRQSESAQRTEENGISPALAQALDAARAIEDAHARARALTELAPHLPEAVGRQAFQEALDGALALEDPYARDWALAELLPRLPEGLLPRALDAARTIRNQALRDRALTELLPRLPEGLLPQALDAVRAIESPYARARALATLAPCLPEELGWQAFRQALDSARAIEAIPLRAWALAKVMPHLPEALLPQDLDAIQATDYPSAQSEAMIRLAPRLPQALLPRALDTARAIRNEGHRVQALAALAPRLPEALLPRALDVMLATEDPTARAWALVELAPRLPEPLLSQALDAMLTLEDPSERDRAMAELVRRLPEALVPMALEAARAFEDPDARARARLASHGPEGQPTDERVPTSRWYLSLEAPAGEELAVGRAFSLTLRLAADERPGSRPLRVPVSALELTFFLEAPGFRPIEGGPTWSLPVVRGIPPQRSLVFQLIPLLSGDQTVRLIAYAGKGLAPTELTLQLPVAAPVALPDVPELIDRRMIPEPHPHVILFVTLEEVPGAQQLRFHVTCPAFGWTRKSLDPPLPFTERDLDRLRQAAVQAAAEVPEAAPPDTLSRLRALGAALFDRIAPPRHPLRKFCGDVATQVPPGSWSWLVISDERVVLPWELFCPSDFLADTFVLSHWIGRQRLRLAAEAPLGRLDLTHYDQRPQELGCWQAAVGAEDVLIEREVGHLDLLEPTSLCYGLHVLRYTDPYRPGQITAAAEGPDPKASRGQAEAMVYDRRPDFARRRPVVGLSFVDGQPARSAVPGAERDTRLEAGWVLPFVRAGASAAVGPRWPVLPEADRLFFQTFYRAVRDGEELGRAVWGARTQVRLAFPSRPDWLAYALFGHPHCEPYLIRPAQGFTLFEALGHPEGTPFLAGQEYQFRASYRAEAPVWYEGRLRAPQPPSQEEVSILVLPLTAGGVPQTYRLEKVPAGEDCQCTVSLRIPEDATTLQLLVRFKKGGQELQTLMLTLKVEKKR